ncbi:tyrosine-type recombinase/integrase [Pseudomonas lundensis]|uniref:tyrosine-type recombinase/integrase n=1 Tax=Pseudomonas lundensis TaxID=86185 RepID=UPI001866F556|nr:tyrosine-type recombinase/integrase [Pseudomonas lundensis]
MEYVALGKTDGDNPGEIPRGFGDTTHSKMTANNVNQHVASWVTYVMAERRRLLEVPLQTIDEKPRISTTYLTKNTGLSPDSLSNYQGFFDCILEAMTEHGIVKAGFSSVECDWRRRLLRWYEGIAVEDKSSIQIFGGKIKVLNYLGKEAGLSGVSNAKKYALVVDTLAEIVEDLRSLGLAPSTYDSVKDRLAKHKPVKKIKLSDLERINKYRCTIAATASDLGKNDSQPFAALLHLFARGSISSHSISGVRNYLDSYNYFMKDLISSGFEGHEPIDEMVGVYSLVRFRRYLESLMLEGRISSHSCNTLISAARKMMNSSREIPGLETKAFITAPGFDTSSETDIYHPYSPAERGRIAEAVSHAIKRTKALIAPYTISGAGQDPLNSKGLVTRGLKTLDNARWIFENKLGCIPIGYKTADASDPYHKAFLAIISAQILSIDQVYENWGVLYTRDSFALTPFLARLAQVTGLNADSLVSLDIQDFEERHVLTNRPCLRYWKERSTGEKEYHLDLFQAEISWLTTSQAREVKQVFDDVIELTASFRHRAHDEDVNRLFIYRSTSPRSYNQVKSVSGSAKTLPTKMFSDFSSFYDLKTDDGQNLQLSPSRFRPSFVSELVERGVSMREVQVILGHKSIRTTISYLERLDLNRTARGILREAIANIHADAIGGEINRATNPKEPVDQSVIIFKTPLGACKNILNPPEFVKKLRGYVPGKPCSVYNKCLACDNRLITKANLPDLYAMRRDYLTIMSNSRVIDTPYGAVVLENLALLEEILDPGMSDYSLVELEEAERLSEYIETSVVVEGVVI